MDIQIIEQNENGTQIIIKCRKADQEVIRLKNHIELFDSKLQAKGNQQTLFISPTEVLYFESVDNRTFLYTPQEVLEISQRLYELENRLSDRDFIRISKSQIVNIHKIKSLQPELNRTITATLCNGERLSISRKYVPVLRTL
ncbi:MAG: LytTR family transcriptional regulator, partial [Lachnospiraceae bacterium]|nr:LytTR family transcriptional regulator [Lachnospiraceae bacterium]